MLFAEQSRDQSLLQAVDDYRSLVTSQGSYADYSFHAIITNPSETVLQDELPVLARQGIMSMKLFLTYKHMRISDDQFLRALLKARELGMVALVHAENGDAIDVIVDYAHTPNGLENVLRAARELTARWDAAEKSAAT